MLSRVSAWRLEEAIGFVEVPGAIASEGDLLSAIRENEIGTSGVSEEQLDNELPEDDLIDGVEARELEVVVLEERDREERFGVCGG